MAYRENTIAPNFAERLRRRSEQIELVMRFEFPGTKAPAPISTLSVATNRQREYEAQPGQDDREARRIELLKMSDEQLAAIHAQRCKEWSEQDRKRREQLTPAVAEPEWQFWTSEDEWALYDAALLLVGEEPRQALGLLLKDLANGRKTAKFSLQVLPISTQTSVAIGRHRQLHGGFIPEDLNDEAKSKLEMVEEITRRALIALRKGRLAMDNGAVEPHAFLRWARSKGYELSASLAQLVPAEQPMPQADASKNTEHATAEPARRRDILSPAIESAMQGTDGSVAAVWPKLRESAIAETPPFNGVDDSALLYTNANNRSARLTHDAVSKRLRRARSAPAKRR